MKIPVEINGTSLELECFDNWVSAVTCAGILRGEVYRDMPMLGDVKVVLDVGAYVGASTLYFSRVYPRAEIFAFEPALAPFELLLKNTQSCANVRAHNFGLFSDDREVPLHEGTIDRGTSSVGRSDMAGERSEIVTLRSAKKWLDQSSVERIDVLKVDTEGCEVPILTTLREHLPKTTVIYVEYHNEEDRRAIDRLLAPTHVLVYGKIPMLHRGELTYVATSAFPPQAFSKHRITLED